MTVTARLLAIALAVPLLGSGCASISKKDCLSGDWDGLGYEDGANGRATTLFASHVKACAKVDVVPDENRYRRAFDQGLLEYCTPERGYREGKRDADYQDVCPAELETAFLQQYLDGLDDALVRLDFEYESTRSSLEADRVRRASLDEAEVSKELRRSIEYGENRVSSINRERLEVREKISRWRRQL